MNVLVVGSGAREHALAWKLAQSPALSELHAAPGNPGIAALGKCHPVRAEDKEGLLALARELDSDLVVVGPEAPLVAGLADHLRRGGIAVFGPSANAARIEGSKTFAKEIMRAAGVPTADQLPVARVPCVVKADGLAAGKGVFICETQEDLDEALRAAARLGDLTVIEELLQGPEVSVFALVDGANVVPLPTARDYSRVDDGDAGPNTGGMGCYSPVPDAPSADELVDALIRPVVAELAKRGSSFVGCMYAGVILTEEGPHVLEYNCRFGDPEAQVLLPRIEGDLLEILAAAAHGDLSGADLRESGDAAVCIAVAAPDYPLQNDSGSPIHGLEDAEEAGALVFHAGTAVQGEQLVTNGGRILGVTAVADSIADARRRAYEACELISFPGAKYRSDIALAAAQEQHVSG
jgi:phosphoribosylamine---glycine ligase